MPQAYGQTVTGKEVNDMAWVMHCDCGMSDKGETQDEVVKNGQDHAKYAHGITLTYEQALGFAERE
jgi:hypothetical protein